MTREEQVRAALKEIMPSPSDRAACRAAIGERLDAVARLRDTDAAYAALHSAEATKALKALHKALVKVRKTYLDLLRSRGATLGAPDAGQHAVRPDLKRWLLDLFEALIKDTEPVPKRVVRSPALRRDRPAVGELLLREGEVLPRAGSAKPMAVASAHLLLDLYCPDQRITTTKGGRWHKLSAILYGDEGVDLYQYLSVFKYFRDQK